MFYDAGNHSGAMLTLYSFSNIILNTNRNSSFILPTVNPIIKHDESEINVIPTDASPLVSRVRATHVVG